MQFNTYVYMLLFLPVTILGYFVINKFSYFFAKIYLLLCIRWIAWISVACDQYCI